MAARLALCLALALLGCSTEEPSGCQKDTDCREGRICENHACTNAGTAGSGGSGGSSACSDPGESCAVNGDCCGFDSVSPQSYCVSGTCAAACANTMDGTSCVSGCCAALAVSGFACAPRAICSGTCFQAGEPCSVNGDCCNFLQGDGFCVGGFCADACDPTAMPVNCVSGCCAQLEGSADYACAPEYICPTG